MTAYAISEIEVLNEEAAEEYRKVALPTIAHYGGRYLVRAVPEAVEGSWSPRRVVMICEWPDVDRAREWYRSPEYAEALKMSKIALDRRLCFVEGLKSELTPSFVKDS
jgi:uncharacterized protein (DUF1330 family)